MNYDVTTSEIGRKFALLAGVACFALATGARKLSRIRARRRARVRPLARGGAVSSVKFSPKVYRFHTLDNASRKDNMMKESTPYGGFATSIESR